MRRDNSSFQTAFLSEAGSELKNNDYFAFVELEDYACYVIADGISDLGHSQSAKEAIHNIITAFQASPSLSKGALKQYLKSANQELRSMKSYEKLKASVTVVVTNYEKIRFGYAGNTRLRIYRDGRQLHSTTDMSLSQKMVEEEKIPADALTKHEERNNLYAYLGQEHFTPFISPRIKLQNADIITLYTRGIWENVDDGELDEVFYEAGNDPRECCDQIEDMLLSRQSERVENYTFVAIFADKIFIDPNRRKKIKQIITISVVAAVIILVISVVLFILYKKREQTKEEMNICYQNTMEYIADGNFVRAEEECREASELAKKLRDKEMREILSACQKLLEALIKADDIFDEGKYIEAEDVYVSAKARSRYADYAGREYIEKKLIQINRYRDVYDNIALGDKLLELEGYEMAEQKYLEAKKDAAFLYFESGKRQALDALNNLYEKWAKAKEEVAGEASGKAADQVSAAELVKKGDEAYAAGDYDGAKVFYLIALEKYTKLEDEIQIALLNKKIIALNEKQEKVKERTEEAKLFEEQARLFMEQGQYDLAKEQYQYAKNIYLELGKGTKADEIQGKIDVVNTKITQQDKEKAEEEKKKSVSGNEA